ncbi:LysR substrate-binding domain-containing protein [Pelagibaculum spongiae]|uniref:LysR family transcriptional regulator n=1 Tax=Pelagibaculum spongiae TaxID=2080658 RepID=A0A2V1GZB5_9GAMM|nr:LysR substrate-binding domain-containing protein [Pelagibaculum spongiae]PVZ72411.1 LysR family transcriptional regulator [Pelagibaculum spongiae]
MNLTIRQLQCFRDVMRAGSISEAARTLNRTQPAVSAMIASLEDGLGLSLFERQRGRLVPKAEAYYFLEETEVILERLSQSTRTMKEIGDLQQGRLRIACMPATAQWYMPKLLAEFVKDKPKLSASLMMRSSAIVEEWVASQQYDIGLCETPLTKNRAITAEGFDLDCVCALPIDDPLTAKPSITPADLDGFPMATLNTDHPTYLDTSKIFAQAQANLVQRFELRNFQPAMELVEQGLCYCICDPITAASYRDNHENRAAIVFKPFTPSIQLSISLINPAHRPLSLLAEDFRALISRRLHLLNAEFQ